MHVIEHSIKFKSVIQNLQKSICHVNTKFQAGNVCNNVASVPMIESQSYVYFEEFSPIPQPNKGPIHHKEKSSAETWGPLFNQLTYSLLNLETVFV